MTLTLSNRGDFLVKVSFYYLPLILACFLSNWASPPHPNQASEDEDVWNTAFPSPTFLPLLPSVLINSEDEFTYFWHKVFAIIIVGKEHYYSGCTYSIFSCHIQADWIQPLGNEKKWSVFSEAGGWGVGPVCGGTICPNSEETAQV